MSSTPPIPARCAHLPLIGGRAIPWVNVRLADGGVDFRSRHEARRVACWTRRLCQICGQLLTHPVVLLGGPRSLRDLVFDEPPMHPECAVYTSWACPMVAGQLERYATGELVSNGKRGAVCPDPGCDCGGWVQHPEDTSKAGEPAHEWYAVYASGFNVALNQDRTVLGGQVDPNTVLRVRRISRPGQGRCWENVPDALTGYQPPETLDPPGDVTRHAR